MRRLAQGLLDTQEDPGNEPATLQLQVNPPLPPELLSLLRPYQRKTVLWGGVYGAFPREPLQQTTFPGSLSGAARVPFYLMEARSRLIRMQQKHSTAVGSPPKQSLAMEGQL